jgi:hypothetical protein
MSSSKSEGEKQVQDPFERSCDRNQYGERQHRKVSEEDRSF